MEEISLIWKSSLNVGNDSAGTIKINIDDIKPQKSVNFEGAEMYESNKNKLRLEADIKLAELNDIQTSMLLINLK